MPEAIDYLNVARRFLNKAMTFLASPYPEEAARAAYLAAFHAARAYVLLKSGRIIKTHSGARSEFSRLAKDDPQMDRYFSSFLGQAYSMKEDADYSLDAYSSVSHDAARATIDTATRMVDAVSALLGPDQGEG